MTRTLLITDSGSDIPQGIEGITVVPMEVTFGDETFQDGVSLSHQQFYERLIESDQLPTTSMIPPARFAADFEEGLAQADELLVVTLSSKLSGTYESALAAAAAYPGRVHVVDSLNACIGEAVVVQRARQLLDEGMGAAAVAAQLERERHQVRLVALLGTLEYLRKGGRLNAAAAVMGEVLAIKPVIAIEEGEVAVLGKARGSKNGANLLKKQILAAGGVDFDRPYMVGYTGLSDGLLQKYIADHGDLWETETHQLPQGSVGATIGTHVGPDAIAVAFFAQD